MTSRSRDQGDRDTWGQALGRVLVAVLVVAAWWGMCQFLACGHR
jgi:hypothetical protein